MMDYYISGRKKKVGNDFVFLRYIRYYEKKVYGIFLFRIFGRFWAVAQRVCTMTFKVSV